jgi:rhodanese-related sulfurtransferase
LPYREISPQEAFERFERGDAVILDVRTMPEWRGGHIPGALHIPLDELTGRYQELDPDAETLVVCAHGIRSAAAGQWLAQVGFENVANVSRGMSGWPGPIELADGRSVWNA